MKHFRSRFSLTCLTTVICYVQGIAGPIYSRFWSQLKCEHSSRFEAMLWQPVRKLSAAIHWHCVSTRQWLVSAAFVWSSRLRMHDQTCPAECCDAACIFCDFPSCMRCCTALISRREFKTQTNPNVGGWTTQVVVVWQSLIYSATRKAWFDWCIYMPCYYYIALPGAFPSALHCFIYGTETLTVLAVGRVK